MNERTWLLGNAGHPLDDDGPGGDGPGGDGPRDDGNVEKGLWTRRSALALTAGLIALGTMPARATYKPTLAPRANHVVVSKSNRVLALMNGADTL